MLKVECGAHIDGYVGVAALTFGLTAEGGSLKFENRFGDVLTCTRQCVEASLRLLKPGTTSTQLRDTVHKLAAEYRCSPIMGVCSHTVGRYLLDGSKVVVWRDTAENDANKSEDVCTVEENDVFVVDIVMSSGEGTPMEVEDRTNIYLRVPNKDKPLKTKAARELLSEIDRDHAKFPFAVRNLKSAEVNMPKIRMGLKEAKEILAPYPVLCVKPDEIVGHAKLTVAVTKNGPIIIAGSQIDPDNVKSNFAIKDEEMLKLLATSLKKKKNKKKNNKKK